LCAPFNPSNQESQQTLKGPLEVQKETSNVSPKCLPFGIETKEKDFECTLILENKFKNGMMQFQAQLKFRIKPKKQRKKKEALFDLCA
jgi:hypothetical protein